MMGQKVWVEGEVVEHLRLGKKEWLTIQLPSRQKVTLLIAHCHHAPLSNQAIGTITTKN